MSRAQLRGFQRRAGWATGTWAWLESLRRTLRPFASRRLIPTLSRTEVLGILYPPPVVSKSVVADNLVYSACVSSGMVAVYIARRSPRHTWLYAESLFRERSSGYRDWGGKRGWLPL